MYQFYFIAEFVRISFSFISISGSGIISKKQEVMYPELDNAIVIATRVNELVEGGMTYQDAVKAEAVEAVKRDLINDDLKKKIEMGTELVNKLKLELANSVGSR